MNDKDKETVKLVANILGNIAAIAVGVALFDQKPQTLSAAVFFAVLAVLTVRGLK